MDKLPPASAHHSVHPDGGSTASSNAHASSASSVSGSKPKHNVKARKSEAVDAADNQKRRCVSTACIACRKRKSKCDGSLPACAACASVYHTECVYDPNSDHRRKGVYKKDVDNLKTRNSTLQTLIHAILNYPDDEVAGLVQKIRACDSLDRIAESIAARDNGEAADEDEDSIAATSPVGADPASFEGQLSTRIGELRLDDGSVRFLGGTSNLLFLQPDDVEPDRDGFLVDSTASVDPVTSWTTVTMDRELIMHLLNMYFTWHYAFFTTLSKSLFFRDFYNGKGADGLPRTKTTYCSPLLVNAMCAVGCHFTARAAARDDPEDAVTAGDHFFREARRLLYEEDEIEKPRLTTVQALAIMSAREAGCGREARGWTFSGMAFRMASDLGINFETGSLAKESDIDENEEDARRITFWGCFLFDKCWSNYMGRLPTYQMSDNVTVPKFDVFPGEEAEDWMPYTDSGYTSAHSQPSRTRAVSQQIIALCDISSDLVKYFYHPFQTDKPLTKQQELKRLSEIHSRLEGWKRELPAEMEPKEGGLSSVLTMHMMFQLLYIHLFRPFLKYLPADSPLPSHVSPRKICTTAGATISKLLRLYKRSHGLRQICNIVVYIAHSACTIHLLNLPDKNAKRDITHGVKHLEEIAEGWPCARRTLKVLSLQVRRWKIELPEEAATTLARTDAKFGVLSGGEGASPSSVTANSPPPIALKMNQAKAVPMEMPPPGAKSAQQAAYGETQAPGNHFPVQSSPLSQEAYGQASVAGNAMYQLPHLSHYSHLGNINQSMMASMAQSSPQSLRDLQVPVNQPQPAPANPDPQQRVNLAPAQPMGQHAQQASQQPAWQSQGRAQQQQQQQPPAQKLPRSASKRSRANGSMFGGVEALLKEGQDWLVKDGSNLANGFGNWQGSSSSGDAFHEADASWYLRGQGRQNSIGQPMSNGMSQMPPSAVDQHGHYTPHAQSATHIQHQQQQQSPQRQPQPSHMAGGETNGDGLAEFQNLDLRAFGMVDEQSWYQ